MTTAGALSDEQRESFDTYGFLKIPDALTPHTLATLRSTCLRLRDQDTQSAKSPAQGDNDWRDHFNHPFNDKQAACDEARWEASNIVTRHRSFMELIDYPKILPIVVELLSDNIFLMRS